VTVNGGNASDNTGSGGGGGGTNGAGGNGASGVVIISIPEANTASFSAGVTQTNAVSGGRRIYTVTAAGNTDSVIFA